MDFDRDGDLDLVKVGPPNPSAETPALQCFLAEKCGTMRTQLGIDLRKCILIQRNSFGVFSHSKGFGAELLSDSLWLSGADPSWAAKTFRGKFHQVPPRFHQGSTKLPQVSWCLWFSGADSSLGCQEVHLGLPKGSVEGFLRFHQGFAKVAQVS